MELDFIENINEYNEHVVRLFNFDRGEATMFRNLIQNVIIENKHKLDLSKVDFIERHDCNLVLGLFKEDEGILSNDNENFFCILTMEGFINMVNILDAYCNGETSSHQYLYDLDTPIDLLFTPYGTALG